MFIYSYVHIYIYIKYTGLVCPVPLCKQCNYVLMLSLHNLQAVTMLIYPAAIFYPLPGCLLAFTGCKLD